MINRFFLTCILMGWVPPALSDTLEKFGVGAGLGTNYAHTIGVHARYAVDQIEFLAAVGMREHYSLGIRYNILNGNGFWQPRIGLNYGTNGDLRTLYSDRKVKAAGYKTTYLGWTLTIGNRFAFGRKRTHGIALDIGYKLTDGGYENDRRKFLDQTANPFSGAAMGLELISGLFGGDYNLLFSVGWEMKF